MRNLHESQNRVPRPEHRDRRGGLRRASQAAKALVSFLCSLLVLAAAGNAAEVSARPGSVVRWSGDGSEFCGRGMRTWPANANTCWFPIDLLEVEGAVAVFRIRAGRREAARIRVTNYPYPVQRIELEDSSKVDLSPEDLVRVRRDQARVKSLWLLAGPARFRLPLAPPLEEMGPAGSFGSRRFFNGQPRSPHSGADYPAAEGATVFSVAPGTVVLASDLFFSGQSVFVDHGDGLVSMYFHLSSMSVAEGMQLESRAVIGEVGETGRTTGPHLHFGLRWRGARVDPSLLLGPVAEIPALVESADPVNQADVLFTTNPRHNSEPETKLDAKEIPL